MTKKEIGIETGKMIKLCGLGFTIALLSTQSFAEDVASPWSAQAEFGFLSSNGNSESQSVNGRFGMMYDIEYWKYQLSLVGLSAAASDPDVVGSEMQTSSERYSLDAQADRKISGENSFFAKANYDDDRFSGFEYETGVAVGYGHQVIRTDAQSFRIEIGPGFRVSKPDAGESEDEALISTAFLFNQKLGATSAFNQSLMIDAGDQRAISTSVTSVSAQIVGQLAMKFSLTIKHNSDPAVDSSLNQKASVDKETSVNLVYSF